MNLTVRILIGMAAGVVVGLAVQAFTSDDHWIQTVLIQDVFDAGGKVFIASLRLMDNRQRRHQTRPRDRKTDPSSMVSG